MKTKKLQKLLYASEHLTCINYANSLNTGFRHEVISADTYLQKDSVSQNYILFFLKGSCIIGSGSYPHRVFKQGEMILIPKSSVFEGRVIEVLEVLIFNFHIPLSSCDKLTFEAYANICQKMDYEFLPTQICYPLDVFVEQVTYLLKRGLKCAHFFEIKHREFFLLLRSFYTKEEISLLLHPIIGKTLSFKDFILENYTIVDSIDKLISKSHLSKSSFNEKFKEDFGVTAKQWMLKQQANAVKAKACEPHVTIKDLMEVIGYSSPAHFNRFCRTYLACTPGELLKSNRT